MPRLLILSMLMFASITTQAESIKLDEVPGFVLWNSASIEAAADRLEKEIGDKHLVYEVIGNYEGHSVYLVLRGRTGTAEFHETESDVQISKRGKAIFVIGGEIVDPEVKPRKQIRGTSIKGGKRFTVTPGDIIHVPPSVAHQLIVDPAEPYMYILFKLDEEPLN